MEIISYVGASSVQRRKTSFHLPNFSEMHVQRARPQKLKFYHTHTSFDALAKRKNFFSSLLNVRWLLKPVFYKYFIPVLAMCILVPMTMVRVTDYIESHGSPVLF